MQWIQLVKIKQIMNKYGLSDGTQKKNVFAAATDRVFFLFVFKIAARKHKRYP